MRRMLKLFICLSFMALVFINVAYAGLINYERLNRNRNRSGVQAQRPLPSWARELPKVRYRSEKRYDVNRDGILQTAETKVYLQDVINEIDRKGGYRVDSGILQAYDKNNDGVISKAEVDDIRRDSSVVR